MGLGHTRCLKAAVPAAVITDRGQELHSSPAAISLEALLHQGLGFTISKRQMPHLYLYQQIRVSAEPTSLAPSTSNPMAVHLTGGAHIHLRYS